MKSQHPTSRPSFNPKPTSRGPWIGVAAAALAISLAAGQAVGQTVCQGPPWLGSNGPELCVNVFDDGTGTSIDLRGPSPIVINRTVGDYRLNLVVTYVASPNGMAVAIEGPVRRTSPGSGAITVRADGGTDTSVAASSGSLYLDGSATSASRTQLGGGAGFRHSSGDVEFRSFMRTCDESTYDVGAFLCEIDEIPVDDGAVAVTNITAFHVNEVDDEIEIPSIAGYGAYVLAEEERLWSERKIGDAFNTYETAIAWLDPGVHSKAIVTNIEVDTAENRLNAYTGSVLFDFADVESYEPLDRGFVMSNFTNCPLGSGNAVVPYIKGSSSSTSVRLAEYLMDTWTIREVPATAADDYHWVTCFNTSQGNYLSAFNFSQSRVEILERMPDGDYELRFVLDDATLGAAPGWFPYPDAGDLYAVPTGWIDQAVLSIPLEDGTLAAVQLNTDPLGVVGIWNAGPAVGDTSVDISESEAMNCQRASMNWMDGGQLIHANWCLDDGPSSARRIPIGAVEPGTNYPDYQGIDGGAGSRGIYNILADKHYVIDDMGNLLPEVWSYPPRTLGGPIAFAAGGPDGVDGVAAWPGSQMVGILDSPEPPNSFAVPAVARVRGTGAFFTSVMHLFNAGHAELELELTFTPRQGSGGSVTTVTHTVPAGTLQTIDDPLHALFGFGGGAGRVGSVLVKVRSGSQADLMLQTVVFAELDTGERYGQFFPAMGLADAIPAGRTVYLNTTEDPDHNRVNIGLMALTNGTRFRVTPVKPIGNGLAPARTFDLAAGSSTQINNLHATFGLGATADVVAKVEVVSGSGLAYASVLDGSGGYGGTSDPTTILPTKGGSDKVTLLEIGSIQGLNEFSGSASITNYSNRPTSVRADFFQRGLSGVTASQTFSIGAGSTVGYTDLAAELFGVSGDVGTVVLSTSGVAGIGATGREFAIFRDQGGAVVGTAGQLIAGQVDVDRVPPGRSAHFIGLRQTRGGAMSERSHLAVYNPAPATAEVGVKLYDGATGALEGEDVWVVEPQTLIQLNNIVRVLNPESDDGEKRIVVESDRWVFMNVFRVNPWGDPVTLSPFIR